MKKCYLLLPALLPFLQSCVADPASGEMKPGWLFWVFLGLLLGGLFFGVIVKTFRRQKPNDAPTLTEKEIEAYEETLDKKLKDSSPDQNKKDPDKPEKKEPDKK